jgi:isopentenyl phosphate kinase
MDKPNLIFLKLGGSLITDKSRPRLPRYRIIHRLAREIKEIHELYPEIKILLGHGSGSFGHISASKYHTIEGVVTPDEWQGFLEVWRDARELNKIIMKIFRNEGLPVLSFPPSGSIVSSNRFIKNWEFTPIKRSIEMGLIPIVFGDVVFDTVLGGTILSTEDLFLHLVPHLKPGMILLAGEENGVWEDYPRSSKLLNCITPENYQEISHSAGTSAGVDVTGGMAQKVNLMVELVKRNPDLKVKIFSGFKSGALMNQILGSEEGTLICR